MKSILFILVFILFINYNYAYKHREIVRVNLQTKLGISGSIEYHDLSPRLAPKFKIDNSKSLLDLDTSNKKVEILPDTLYRILFSFDSDRFKTTWITVSDGNGKYLNHIDFIFIYSNDKIIDLKWNLDYNDEEVHHGKKPTNFYINYRWEEIRDKDLSSGLFTLFTVGLVISGISFIHISISFASKSSRIKNLPSYYQKVKSDANIINNSYNNRNNFNNNRNSFNNNDNSISNSSYSQQQYQSPPYQENNENIVQTLTSYDTSPSYHLSPPPIANENDNGNSVNDNNNNNNNNNSNSNNNLDVSDSEIESFVELNDNRN